LGQSRPEFSGLAIALLCGVVLGTAVVVSRFAYDAGASGVVVAISRTIVMTTAFFFVLKIMRRSLRVPKKLLLMSLVNGVLMGIMTFGNIGAVEFIPIGLASLLFFTFPIIIAILVIAFRIEHVTWPKVLAIIVAFVGIATMLGDSVGEVDGRGVALALMGATATAVNAILVGRYFKGVDVLVMTFYFSIGAFVFLLILAATIAEVRYPQTPIGWGGVVGVAILQSIGTPLYFYAIAKIGALKTGIAANIQPVTSVLEAWLVFDEVLAILQALGGALVLAGIGFMQWADFKARRKLEENLAK
jgi:drug/metabolite transporter (DMT)-like permease